MFCVSCWHPVRSGGRIHHYLRRTRIIDSPGHPKTEYTHVYRLFDCVPEPLEGKRPKLCTEYDTATQVEESGICSIWTGNDDSPHTPQRWNTCHFLSLNQTTITMTFGFNNPEQLDLLVITRSVSTDLCSGKSATNANKCLAQVTQLLIDKAPHVYYYCQGSSCKERASLADHILFVIFALCIPMIAAIGTLEDYERKKKKEAEQRQKKEQEEQDEQDEQGKTDLVWPTVVAVPSHTKNKIIVNGRSGQEQDFIS